MSGVTGCAMTFCASAPEAAGWAVVGEGGSAVRLIVSRCSFVETYLPDALHSTGNFGLEIDDGGVAESSVRFVRLVLWAPSFGDSPTVGPCLPYFLAPRSISITLSGQAMSRVSVGRTTQV